MGNPDTRELGRVKTVLYSRRFLKGGTRRIALPLEHRDGLSSVVLTMQLNRYNIKHVHVRDEEYDALNAVDGANCSPFLLRLNGLKSP